MKIQTVHKNYAQLSQNYQLKLPIDLEIFIPEDDSLILLIYAYMNDIWSSRKIELACKIDINFMWLLQGFKAPNHNTIARFRTGRLEPILDDLFNSIFN